MAEACPICHRAAIEHHVFVQKLNKVPTDWTALIPVIRGHDLIFALVIACERPECVRKAAELYAAGCGPGWEVSP